MSVFVGFSANRNTQTTVSNHRLYTTLAVCTSKAESSNYRSEVENKRLEVFLGWMANFKTDTKILPLILPKQHLKKHRNFSFIIFYIALRIGIKCLAKSELYQ